MIRILSTIASAQPTIYIDPVNEREPTATALPWDYLGLVTDTGEANMALDRLLLSELQSGKRQRPVLRFYRWAKPTVSLGTNQTAGEVVVMSEVRRLGYDLVKRPTGGRALLHKGDICYAIAAHRDYHPCFHSLTSTYRTIGTVIAGTLQSLGIDLTDLPAAGTESRHGRNPCFAMLSPFEVTVGGKKICGSAQYRSGGFFLQHGSLLVRDGWDANDLTSIWPAGYALDGSRITCVDRERGEITDFTLIQQQFVESFARQLGATIIGI